MVRVFLFIVRKIFSIYVVFRVICLKEIVGVVFGLGFVKVMLKLSLEGFL